MMNLYSATPAMTRGASVFATHPKDRPYLVTLYDK